MKFKLMIKQYYFLAICSYKMKINNVHVKLYIIKIVLNVTNFNVLNANI